MSKIEWTDETWNPVVGCTPVSSGCANCYAASFASRFGAVWPGVAVRGKWTKKILLRPETLDVPMHWKKPRRVFVCSMSDLFHEAVPFAFIGSVFKVAAACPQHRFQFLTKRPERMAEFISWLDNHIGSVMDGPPTVEGGDIAHDRVAIQLTLGKNIWLGTSCENQTAADERIPHLQNCPAALRFLSCEPLLGPIDLCEHDDEHGDGTPIFHPGIRWVIVGGESGPRARSCDVEWIRGIVRQCQGANVPCFVKQIGALPSLPVGADAVRWVKECPDIRLTSTGTGTYFATTKHSKGGDPAEWPADLRVREWPNTEDK